MAAVEVTITGTLYDKLNRTTQQVVLIGEASLTGIGVGGGPIIPPPQSPGTPTHPIMLPGMPGWPSDPATMPPPGSPPVALPGPGPVAPIVPPPAIIVDYPGVGKVLVPCPVTAPAKK